MLEEIIEAARQAGKIMLEAEKASIDVKEKTGSANFVTQYDMAVQENLRQALQFMDTGTAPFPLPWRRTGR